jgi:WD40 repeat protein
VTADQIELYKTATFGYDLSAISPNQRQILLIEPGASEPSNIYLCGARDGGLVHFFQADETTNAGQFDPHEQIFAINEGRGTIQILDANNWNYLATFDVRDGKEWRNTNELAFHPTNSLLAFAMDDYVSNDYSIRVWDIDKREQIATLKGYNSSVLGLAFSADGTILAASGADGVIRLWGVPSG